MRHLAESTCWRVQICQSIRVGVAAGGSCSRWKSVQERCLHASRYCGLATLTANSIWSAAAQVYNPYLLINKKRYAGLLWTSPDKWDKMDAKVRRRLLCRCARVSFADDT